MSILAQQASRQALQHDSVRSQVGLEQRLKEAAAQLVTVQDERQKLWAHISELQLAASDAEQIQVFLHMRIILDQ